MSSPSHRQKFWLREAGKLTFRYNFAWWVSEFFNVAVFLTLFFACLLLLLRKLDYVFSGFWITWATALFVAGLFALWRLRRHRFTLEDALIRLESQMGLKNRLSSANAGVGEFPEPQSKLESGWRWHWLRLFTTPALCLLLFLFAAKFPIYSEDEVVLPTELPPALTQTEVWVESLAEEKLPDEKKLEDLSKELEALKNAPVEEWYSQANLEAADHLREQTANSIQELSRNLQTAETMLDALQKLGDQLPADSLQQIDSALKEAAQKLAMGNLPLNPETLKKLKSIDSKSIRKMNAADMKALRERLQKGLETTKKICKVNLSKDGDIFKKLAGEGIGNGQIRRGPGSVPLALQSEKTDLGTQKAEGLSSEDMSRALPGEVEQLSITEHDVDTSDAGGPVDAGKISSSGSGGDAVWKDSFTPEERKLLQRFFK